MAYRSKLDDELRRYRQRLASTVTPTGIAKVPETPRNLMAGGRISVDGPYGTATATGAEIEQARRQPGPPETGGLDLTTPYGKSMFRVGIQRGAIQEGERRTAAQELDAYLERGRDQFPTATQEGPVGVPTTGQYGQRGGVSLPMKGGDTRSKEAIREWIDKMPFEEQQRRYGKATPQATEEFQVREKTRRMKGFRDWAERHGIKLDEATPQRKIELLKIYVKQSNSEDRSADNLLDNQMLKYDVDMESADKTKERVHETTERTGTQEHDTTQAGLDREAEADKAKLDRESKQKITAANIVGRKEVAEIAASGKAAAAELKLLEAQQKQATGAFRRKLFEDQLKIINKRIDELDRMLEVEVGFWERKWGDLGLGVRPKLIAERQGLSDKADAIYEQWGGESKPQATTRPATATGLPVVKTEAELKQYPSGTRVIGPSGREVFAP